MKQVGFSPGLLMSSARTIGEPALQPGRASEVRILTAPMSQIRQQADQLNREHVFSMPRIALWERELESDNIPSPRDRGRVIILSGQDVLSFCRQHNDGNLPQEPKAIPRRGFIGKLLDWLLPERKRSRNRRWMEGDLQRRDAMVDSIKRYAAAAKGLPRLPDWASPQVGKEHRGKLTYITVD